MKKYPKINSSLVADGVVWCIRNGYKIFPVTSDNRYYRVHVVKGGDEVIVDKQYTKTTIDKAIDQMYYRIYKQKVL